MQPANDEMKDETFQSKLLELNVHLSLPDLITHICTFPTKWNKIMELYVILTPADR